MRRFAIAMSVLAALCARAAAQSTCHAENDGTNFYDAVSMGGPITAVRFVAPANLVITRIEVFTGETTSTHTVGLWSDNSAANQPLAALASGSFPVQFANSWQGADLASSVPLTNGTTYWMAWTPTGGGQASLDLPMTTLGQVYRPSFDGGQTWTGPFQFTDRHWKFRLIGLCNSAPVVFCTSGTSTNGCTPSISAANNPSINFAQPCSIALTGVEGQKSGIVFYGLQALPQPWCVLGGGSSFLCVKPPTQRTIAQSSGGTIGQCNGAFALDWNAFQLATPGALGQPWLVGAKAYVQGWYRDPPACKTTGLSNALELTYLP